MVVAAGRRRGGRSGHRRAGPGRAGGRDPAGRARAQARYRAFEIVDARAQPCGRREGRGARPRGQGEMLMKGSLHTDELMRGGDSLGRRTAHRAAHQPRLRHGRADLSRDRCSSPTPPSTSFPTSTTSATSSRTRSTLRPGRPRHAARGHPVGGGDGDLEDSVDDRGGGALQDGRPRADHRRPARRAAGLRQRHRPRGGAGSRASSPRSRAGRTSWSSPTSRPATCWPRS